MTQKYHFDSGHLFALLMDLPNDWRGVDNSRLQQMGTE